MENRKKLHDCGLVLIVLGILNVFNFASTIVSDFVYGSFIEDLAAVEADILVAVKVMLGVLSGFMTLLIFADVFIGIKALKVSKNPNADKGYIIAAKLFFAISVIVAISNIVSLIEGSAPVIDTIINLASSVLGAGVYVIFVNAAQDVRRDVLSRTK